MRLSNATKGLSVSTERMLAERQRQISWRIAQQQAGNPHQARAEAAENDRIEAENAAAAALEAAVRPRQGLDYLTQDSFASQEEALFGEDGPTVQQGSAQAGQVRTRNPQDHQGTTQRGTSGGDAAAEDSSDDDEPEFEVGAPPEESSESRRKPDTQVLFEAAGNCKKLLMAMCLGLESDGRDLGNAAREPYSTASQKTSFIASSAILKEECRRRALKHNLDEVKCSYWPKKKCVDWLESHPTTDPDDTAWLISTEEQLFKILVEEAEEREATRRDNASWTTNDPWLRLYMCMCDDSARTALLTKDDALSREGLDARRSVVRPKTYFEIVAELYNNEDKTFVTDVLPDLHQNFADPIVLEKEDMPGGDVSAEEVKRRFADARAKLIKVIENFE